MTRYYSICKLNQSFRSPRLPSGYTSRVELTSSSIYSKNIFRASSISTKLSTRSSYGPFRIGRVTGSRGEVLSLQRLFQGKNRELSSTVVIYCKDKIPIVAKEIPQGSTRIRFIDNSLRVSSKGLVCSAKFVGLFKEPCFFSEYSM